MNRSEQRIGKLEAVSSVGGSRLAMQLGQMVRDADWKDVEATGEFPGTIQIIGKPPEVNRFAIQKLIQALERKIGPRVVDGRKSEWIILDNDRVVINFVSKEKK